MGLKRIFFKKKLKKFKNISIFFDNKISIFYRFVWQNSNFCYKNLDFFCNFFSKFLHNYSNKILFFADLRVKVKNFVTKIEFFFTIFFTKFKPFCLHISKNVQNFEFGVVFFFLLFWRYEGQSKILTKSEKKRPLPRAFFFAALIYELIFQIFLENWKSEKFS